MYSISYPKFLKALKAFKDRGGSQWTNDLNILIDGKTLDWFVIEKPTESKLTEIHNFIQKNKALTIEDNGPTENQKKTQHNTQFDGCYLVFGNDARYLSNNIRE